MIYVAVVFICVGIDVGFLLAFLLLFRAALKRPAIMQAAMRQAMPRPPVFDPRKAKVDPSTVEAARKKS